MGNHQLVKSNQTLGGGGIGLSVSTGAVGSIPGPPVPVPVPTCNIGNKGTVNVISSDPPCKYINARFTRVPLKT